MGKSVAIAVEFLIGSVKLYMMLFSDLLIFRLSLVFYYRLRFWVNSCYRLSRVANAVNLYRWLVSCCCKEASGGESMRKKM